MEATPTTNRLRITLVEAGDYDTDTRVHPDVVLDVLVTIVYSDGSFDVIPVDATDDHSDFTVYPADIGATVLVEKLAA